MGCPKLGASPGESPFSPPLFHRGARLGPRPDHRAAASRRSPSSLRAWRTRRTSLRASPPSSREPTSDCSLVKAWGDRDGLALPWRLARPSVLMVCLRALPPPPTLRPSLRGGSGGEGHKDAGVGQALGQREHPSPRSLGRGGGGGTPTTALSGGRVCPLFPPSPHVMCRQPKGTSATAEVVRCRRPRGQGLQVLASVTPA